MTGYLKRSGKGILMSGTGFMEVMNFPYLAESFNEMTDSILSQVNVQQGSADIINTIVGSDEIERRINSKNITVIYTITCRNTIIPF